MAIFAILNILKFVLLVAALIIIGVVLAKSKRKRRDQFNESLHQLINETDPNRDQNNTGI